MIRAIKPILAPHKNADKYLEWIDHDQIYVNGGRCLHEFEKRLSQHFVVDDQQILCFGNGTVALQVALMALTENNHGFCMMPSWTFTATPASAISAGLTPFFVDVDPTSWALTPEIALEIIKRSHHRFSCILPVSPFGYLIDPKQWDDFTEQTGTPVLIDAAAMFVNAQFSKTPMMISMHATKTFGIGEGGLIGSTDSQLMAKIKKIREFGMAEDRLSNILGTNGKLSEYAAAFGLAQLDDWPEKEKKLRYVAQQYKQAFSNTGIRLRNGYADQWYGANLMIELSKNSALELSQHLSDHAIESRFWWRQGCHNQSAYKFLPRLSVPITDKLAKRTLGIPFYQGLKTQEIQYIVKAISEFIHQNKKSHNKKSSFVNGQNKSSRSHVIRA